MMNYCGVVRPLPGSGREMRFPDALGYGSTGLGLALFGISCIEDPPPDDDIAGEAGSCPDA